MNWSEEVLKNIEWNGTISNLEAKQKIADKLAGMVQDGEVIGFGSGSTSLVTVQTIAERVNKEKLNITAIPTSYEIKLLCDNLGIKTSTLTELKPDWYFDGADEVDPHGWLIKGRGGAMFREKLIMSASPIRYILVDESKFVNSLCEKFPIPVECVPESICYVKNALLSMGAKSCYVRLAKGKDGPIITESGNIILDVVFENVDRSLEKKLKSIVGVIETGLFIDYDVNIERA